MIRFGLRLALASGREAAVRLVILALAVALGTGLLLATLAGVNAVNAQNARYAWLSPVTASAQSGGTGTGDPLWWRLRGDYFDGQLLGRVDVAGTGAHSPVPPGIPRLPGPAEYYASPALHALLATTPRAELADRFPGREIGTVGPSALPAPNSLLVIIGHDPAELARTPGARQVAALGTTSPADCSDCVGQLHTAALDLVLSVVAGALLFPVLIFIGTATRITATRREQRFAAMRLIGATPRQISVISAVESTAGAVAGTLAGFGIFLALRGPTASIPFTGQPFFPSDMSLNLLDVLLVGLGVPVGAAVSARLALRRVRISPLGVTRRTTPRPPRAYRLIPLAAGLGELVYFIGRRPTTGNGQAAAFLPGFLLIMAGLVIAGPWLTMVGARLLARRSGRPATLIAARRLADNPKAGFRAISGLVLGLFVTSVAVGVIGTIVANRGTHQASPLARTTLSVQFWPDPGAPPAPASVPTNVLADLRSTPGVRSASVVRANPAVAPGREGSLPGVISCADLAAAGVDGRCPAGAAVVAVPPDLIGAPWQAQTQAQTHARVRPLQVVWPAVPVSVADLARLPVLSVVVGTDGSTRAVEQGRTILEHAFPDSREPPTVDGDFRADLNNTLNGWRQLANVVILASLPIAGCSLAVSVAGGLSERKRPFSLMRLSGVPLRVLRRVVALESAVPLLIVAAVAVGTGFLAADLFLRAQMAYTVQPPGAGYYLTVLAGLAVSLGIIASTLPLLERVTGPETARNE